MRNLTKIFCFLFIIISGFSTAFAASTTGTASIKIVKILTMNNNSQLNFGNFVPGATAETISVTGSGSSAPTFTPSSGIVLLTSTTPAQFSTTGEGATVYNITIPSSVTLNGPSSSTMTFSGITIQGGSASRTLSGVAGGTGTDSFYLNGTLNVSGNQTPGIYTGVYSISAHY